MPRRLIRRPGAFPGGRTYQFVIARPTEASLRPPLRRLRCVLEHRLLMRLWRQSADARVRIEISSRIRQPQGYRLTIDGDEIVIEARMAVGVWHAVSTLEQLCLQSPRNLPCVQVEDWPDVPNRGVLLDISRDKVPTMRTLRAIIDWLASLKINQLQLYMEHTFAYRGHRAVWRGASPLTASEVRRLDSYCRDRFIELVPCQNTLGHMERWLKHPRYAPLAEATGPWRSHFGDIRTTRATLNPADPRSLKLVRSLLDELLPCFSSGQVNVNCDEPFELGQGRSAARCRRRGVDGVFAEHANRLRRIALRHGRRMMCWADMAARYRRVLRMIPRDIILMEWGYEADHPFAARCRAYSRAGFDFYVCPGTSSWCSFAGRMTNAVANLREAAVAAKRLGAAGYLITDWGDFGHRQYWPASKPPIVYGAAAAWNAAGLRSLVLPRAASLHAFGDPIGRAAEPWLALGDIYRLTRIELKNKTALFRVMQARLDDVTAIAGLTKAALRRVRRRLAEIARLNGTLRPRGAEERLVAAELAATIRVLRHACERADLMLRLNRGNDFRMDAVRLAKDVRNIMRDHRRLWQARNRPGALRDSLSHYGRMAGEYARWARSGGNSARAMAYPIATYLPRAGIAVRTGSTIRANLSTLMAPSSPQQM